jgi:C4-dicarboxylate-specific signal transduction histidine kinase
MIDYAHKAEQAKKQDTENENYIKAIKALLERQRELPIYMAKALEQELERLEENE